MYIDRLVVKNFRNIKKINIDFNKTLISFTEIMPKEKQVFLRAFIFAPREEAIKHTLTRK